MLREKTGVEKHDIALVMGSGWLPAVDALGEATAELSSTDLPGFAPPAVAGHAGQDPVGARRRPEPAGVPRPHPLLRGPRRACRGARGAHGGGGRVPRRGAHQRLRRPEGDLAARHAGADQRPHQPDRHVTDRGRELRRPHRPLQPAAARAVPLRRRLARRGRLRPAAGAALRDPGRDRHGPRDRRRPGRHVDHARGDRRPRGRPGGARHLPGHQPRGGHHRRGAQPRGGPRGRPGRRRPDGRAPRRDRPQI